MKTRPAVESEALKVRCPRCDAPRWFPCCYVTPLGFVQIDREVRTHKARLAKAARLRAARQAQEKP